MSLTEYKPVPLPKLGGLYTFLKPLDVPSGYSPNLSNVRFLPRAVLTRPGLTARMTKGNVSFNGLAQLISNFGSKILVSLDSNGAIDFQDSNTGNPDSLQPVVADAGSFMLSKIAFGRTFFSFFNSDLSPAGLIRQWNGQRQLVAPAMTNAALANLPAINVVDSATADANWPVGPVNYSVVILFEHLDGSYSFASQTVIWASAGGFRPTVTNIPIGAAQYNVVARWVAMTAGTGGPTYRFPQFRIADNVTTSITLAGISSSFLTMQFSGYRIDNLSAGVNPPPLPHVAPDGPAGAPTAADSANTGSIAVGTHMVWVAWETIFGYVTSPSPSTSWSAAGGKKGIISKLPIGPWYVTARRIFFSSVGGASAFYLSTFRVPNNTTTSVEVDFTDTNLLQGLNVDYLFKNFAMPEGIGVASYGGRLCTWGARNNIQATTGVDNNSVVNLGFDGGWDYTTGLPLGWAAGTNSGNGFAESVLCYAGEAWRISTLTNQISGMITNAQLVSRNMLSVLTPYSVSVWLRAEATVNGTAVIELYSPSLGSLGIFSVALAQIKTTFQRFSGQITTGLASIPSDLVLRVYTNGGLTFNTVTFDHISIYPTQKPIETSLLRISNPFDTETFDNTNGFTSIAKDNGEAITAVVQLRSFLYVLKERSMHVTYDDTINPASLWLVRQIDSTIGCGSPRGLISSDTFIAFSSRGGAYMFTGARPQKVSQEIQTTWNQLNWTYAASTHTLLDSQAKLVYFFVPMGTDTSPKNALILDYSEGVGEEDNPGPRKWGKDQWSQSINCSLKFENSSASQALSQAKPNTQAIYFGGSKVYEHVGADDDGTSIDSYYETAFLKASDQGTDLFGGLVFYAEGVGQMNVTLIGIDDVVQQGLQAQNLTVAPGQQFEVYANQETERARIRFESSVDNTSFILKGVSIMAIPWAVQRPH